MRPPLAALSSSPVDPTLDHDSETSAAPSTQPYQSDTPMVYHDNQIEPATVAEAFEMVGNPGDDHEMDDVEEAGAPLVIAEVQVLDNAMDIAEDEPIDATAINVQHISWSQAILHGLPPEIEQTPPTPPPAPVLPAIGNPVHAQMQMQMQMQLQIQHQQDLDDEVAEDLAGMHPAAFSVPNNMTLAPENFGLVNFLRAWAYYGNRPGRGRNERSPHITHILAQARNRDVTRVEYNQLRGDECDFQGLDWDDLGVTRREAREHRAISYHNYVNKAGSDRWTPGLPDVQLPDNANFFRFRRMHLRRDVHLLHFQLRNILGCASRSRVFYPSMGVVRELNPTTGRTKKAMDFQSEGDVQISTLVAEENILVAGDFSGSYRFRSLDSDSSNYVEGRLTTAISGITNHVQTHPSRKSGAPIAAFSSNDYGFRVVDLTTNTLLSENKYSHPLNCSAISTDRRLRVMVGDHKNVLIADAESGEVMQDLPGHRDFGFACDWAPDGWTVATGFQDKSIRIWDARNWCSPVAVIRTEMSGARGLRFSPLGSGKRVLAAAEEADVVHIIDAQTFETKQKMEMFGEIGGISFTNDGQSLMALNCDRFRGGIMQSDRCDAGAEDIFDYTENPRKKNIPHMPTPGYDWMHNPGDVLGRRESQETLTQRRRKAALMVDLEPF